MENIYQRLLDIRKQKIDVVKNQHFEKAAELRSVEKSIITALSDTIQQMSSNKDFVDSVCINSVTNYGVLSEHERKMLAHKCVSLMKAMIKSL